MLSRGWEDFLGRAGGPLTFRLIIQPTVAVSLAIRAGLRGKGVLCSAESIAALAALLGFVIVREAEQFASALTEIAAALLVERSTLNVKRCMGVGDGNNLTGVNDL